ncbi:MAG: hypothetical protein IPO21_05750 [Bacteroidales bacterium]|nr:hypothetical protein [Bacteroidales bacterium]
MPDEGLTIWWVNENGDNQNSYRGEWEIRLIHADNDTTQEYNACFKQGGNSVFSEVSIPKARWTTAINMILGTKIGLRCWDIGTAGDVIHYKFDNKICNALNVVPYVKYSDGSVVQTNKIEFCLGANDFTLSPTPLNSSGWVWYEYGWDLSYGYKFSNNREVTLSGKDENFLLILSALHCNLSRY